MRRFIRVSKSILDDASERNRYDFSKSNCVVQIQAFYYKGETITWVPAHLLPWNMNKRPKNKTS